VPNRGAVVRVPVPWEVREAYEVRAELESLAAKRAVDRLDDATIAELRAVNTAMYERSVALAAGAAPERDGTANDQFHGLIYEASANTRLTRMLGEINDAFPRNVSALVLRDSSRHREENFREHEALLEAFTAGDGELAAELMRQHVLRAGEHLAHWYERRSSTVFTG